MTGRGRRNQRSAQIATSPKPLYPLGPVESPRVSGNGNGHEKRGTFKKEVLSLEGTLTLVQETDGRASMGEAVRLIRREKKITQEFLAVKAGVDRSTIGRIERRIFKSVSVETLDLIAAAFEMDLKSLLLKAESMGKALTYRGHSDEAAFVIDYPNQGFRIVSLLPKKKEFFFGRIEIQPEKTIPSPCLPHPEQVCLNILEGEILVTVEGKPARLKAGDYYAFRGSGEYEISNPQFVKPSRSLFVTHPSFLAS